MLRCPKPQSISNRTHVSPLIWSAWRFDGLVVRLDVPRGHEVPQFQNPAQAHPGPLPTDDTELGPTITAMLQDGPLAGTSIDIEEVEGSPPKDTRPAASAPPMALSTSSATITAAPDAGLVSGLGGSERIIAALGTRNGRTLPTHGAGSRANVGGVGRHAPGSEPMGKSNGAFRPSFARAASIAAAAALPAAMPPSLRGPSGTAASEAS